jgi:oligopeptidase B
MIPGMRRLLRLPAVLLLPCAALPSCTRKARRPPEAERRPFMVKSPHGDRNDDYFWLRDDGTPSKRPEVMRHLEAENRHTEAVLAPLKPCATGCTRRWSPA